MNSEMLFKYCIGKAEDIMYGIDKDMEQITDDEWANMAMGSICSDIREDKIAFNKMIYRERLLEKSKYTLFKPDNEVMDSIIKIFNNIITYDMDFSTLEKIFVSILNMGYYVRANGKNDNKFDIDIILKHCSNDAEKKYLELLSEIIYYKWLMGYKTFNRQDIHNIDIMKLVDKAIDIYPNAQVAYMYKEIDTIDRFFKNPNDNTLQYLEQICFSEKGNEYIGHIMTYASNRKWDCYVPSYRFLPHINYEFGAGMNYTDIEGMQFYEPQLGYYLNKPSQFQKDCEIWKSNSIKTLLEIPYTIRIEQSEGEIVYNLLINSIQSYKLNKALKNLLNKLNLISSNNNNNNKDISAEEFDKMTNNIDIFLKENKELILQSSIYNSKYEKRLDSLVDKYKEKLNSGTISDIQASRDLSRIAPEKMDLILMPIFRSIEQEIRSKVFDIFFSRFKGLNYNSDNSKTAKNFENENCTLGVIGYYDQDFFKNSYENTLAYYFKKLLEKAKCDENYYKMIEVIKKDKDNKLSFSEIRNAIAHRNEEEINKFPKDIVHKIMDELIEAPDELFEHITKISEKFIKYLSGENVVPLKNSIVKVYLDNAQYCFELNGFIYKCTKPQDLNKAIVVEYIEKEKRWKVK